MTAQEARELTDLKIKESVYNLINIIEQNANNGINSIECNRLDENQKQYFIKLGYEITYNKYTYSYTISW